MCEFDISTLFTKEPIAKVMPRVIKKTTPVHAEKN